jgi:hypothetical protein
MLSIDQKWLELSENNAEIVLKLITNEKSDNLESIKDLITNYLNNPKLFEEETNDQDKIDLKKIFWKLPLIVSSYFAAKESFLKFNQVFRPKLRGQHGAGVTSVEKDIVLKYSNLGKTDTEIFKEIANNNFV